MKNGSRVAPAERRSELAGPLDRKAVGAEGLVLLRELDLLLLVRGEAEAAGSPERVTGNVGEILHRALCPAPELRRARSPDCLRQNRIRRRASAQREAPVASACPAGDLSRVVEANAQAGLGERQRARAAGDPAADDGHVGRGRQLH